MGRPLVTVFIPVYNCEQYIKEALESIINQTYKNLDILIVDDGSTDSSLNIVKDFKDYRIRIIRNHKNMGIPYTRNVGLRESLGEYMAVMDADDISCANRIEKQVEFMEKNRDVDVVGTYYQKFGGRFNRTIKSKFTSSEEIKISLLFFDFVPNSTTLIRLNTVKKYNIAYHENCFVGEDYKFFAEISKVGKICIYPEILFKNRVGHWSISKKTKKSRIVERKEVISSIHNDLIEFYKFKLSDKDLMIYNDFFNDNPIEYLNKIKAEKIINIIYKVNNNNEVFNEGVFKKIFHKNIVIALANQRMNLVNKLKIYNKANDNLGQKSTINDLIFIIIKHIYKYLCKK